jgi:hypothetical protein
MLHIVTSEKRALPFVSHLRQEYKRYVSRHRAVLSEVLGGLPTDVFALQTLKALDQQVTHGAVILSSGGVTRRLWESMSSPPLAAVVRWR